MKRDQKFFDMYTLVIGLLAIFAVGILVFAMNVASLTQGEYTTQTDEYRAEVEERLRPFGKVYLPGEELTADGPQVPPIEAAEPVAASLSGPQVYNEGCNICHGAGIADAPMLSDAAAWEDRLSQGVDVLKDHAVNGFTGAVGYMPPKGGNASLTDAEVESAVDFIVEELRK